MYGGTAWGAVHAYTDSINIFIVYGHVAAYGLWRIRRFGSFKQVYQQHWYGIHFDSRW